MDEQPIAILAIRKRLQRLSYLKLVAFSASCCECLLPHYAIFVQRFHSGDIHPLRCALDRVWDKLDGEPILRLEYEALAKRCAEVTPDPECFEENERSFAVRARRAADAISETFGGCAQRSCERSLKAARLALDAVAPRLPAASSSSRSLSEVFEDARAVHELRGQLDVIALLEVVETLSPSFLAGLRASVAGQAQGRNSRGRKGEGDAKLLT